MNRQGDWLMALAASLLLHGGAALWGVTFLAAADRPPLPVFASGEISLDVVMAGGVRADAQATMAESSPLPEERTVPTSASIPEVDRIALQEPAPVSATPSFPGVAAEKVDPLSLVAPGRLPSPSGTPVPGVGVSTKVSSESPGGGTQGVRDQPAALAEIRPRYPYRARSEGQEGSVTVRVRVSVDGRMQSAEVVQGSGFANLDEAAVGAVRKAGFVPAERGGQRVEGEIDLTFRFQLKD